MKPLAAPKQDVRSRTWWATALRDEIEDVTANIVRLGQRLAEPKSELESAEFYAMVLDDLGRTKRWAQQLVSIASNPAVVDAKHVSHLPADTCSLYALSRLEPRDVDKLVADEVITESSSRRVVRVVTTRVREARKAGREPARIVSPVEEPIPLPKPKPYVPEDPGYVLFEKLSDSLQALHSLGDITIDETTVGIVFQLLDERGD